MTEPRPVSTRKLDQLSDRLRRRSRIPEQVAVLVHDLIISGELKPGDRIVESRLAKKVGIGHPTVREALVALEHQGLVVRNANQGCFVTKLSSQEITQILNVRSCLEIYAVERAVGNAVPEDVTRITDAASLMRQAGEAGDIPEFYRCDLNFHRLLWDVSKNPFLVRSLSQLMVPLLTFRMLRDLRDQGHVDMVESADRHTEIAQAIGSGNKAEAIRVASEKLEIFTREHLNEGPAASGDDTSVDPAAVARESPTR